MCAHCQKEPCMCSCIWQSSENISSFLLHRTAGFFLNISIILHAYPSLVTKNAFHRAGLSNLFLCYLYATSMIFSYLSLVKSTFGKYYCTRFSVILGSTASCKYIDLYSSRIFILVYIFYFRSHCTRATSEPYSKSWTPLGSYYKRNAVKVHCMLPTDCASGACTSWIIN